MMQGLRILSIDTCKQSPINSLLNTFFDFVVIAVRFVIVTQFIHIKNMKNMKKITGIIWLSI